MRHGSDSLQEVRSAPPIVRAAMVVLIGIIIASLIIVPAALGTTLKVTGTLVLPADAAAPSPTAIAVITLIDATNTSDAGNIIGEQRIDGIGDGVISFAVPIEGDMIVPKHAYAVFATVVDDDQSWQNPKGVPVITGGPVEGVKVPIALIAVGSDLITGDIVLPSGAPSDRARSSSRPSSRSRRAPLPVARSRRSTGSCRRSTR